MYGKIRIAYNQDKYGDLMTLEVQYPNESEWTEVDDCYMSARVDGDGFEEWVHEGLIHTLLEWVRSGFNLEPYIYDYQQERYRTDFEKVI